LEPDQRLLARGVHAQQAPRLSDKALWPDFIATRDAWGTDTVCCGLLQPDTPAAAAHSLALDTRQRWDSV